MSFELKKISRGLVDKHYAHVVARPFYPWLARYSTAGASYVMVLEVADTDIDLMRTLLGNTLSHKAERGSIREQFGVYAGVNCFHMSDSAAIGRMVEDGKLPKPLRLGTHYTSRTVWWEHEVEAANDGVRQSRLAPRIGV